MCGWTVRTASWLAVGVAALVGMPGWTLAASPACELAVTVTPATTPGGSRKAQVHVPVGRADVRFRVSTGTSGAPLRASPDTLVAEFTPAPLPPPLALVAAVGGNLCGFSVVRLTGDRGLPATAAPVTLVVVDPPASRGDKDAQVAVFVFAADGKGAPRRGPAPSFRPSIGTVSAVEAVGAGAWRARWAIPAHEATSARVEAVFEKEPAAAGSLARTPGPPAAIEIFRAPGSGGSGESASAVMVRVRDAAGNLTDAPLTLEADTVKLGKMVRVEAGVYRVPLLVLPGSREQDFVITARTEGAEGRATFSTAYSAAAEVRVTPRGPFRADTSSQGQFEVLDVAVVDANGNPVSDTPVGSGGGGHFRDAFPVGPGRWALPYRPAPITEDGTERVVVTAGEASTTVELELVARRVTMTAGAKAGLATASAGTGFGVGVEGGAWTRVRKATVGLVVDLEWWMLSRTSTAMVGSAGTGFETTRHHPSLLLSAAGRIPLPRRWTLGATLGAGLGMVWNRSQLDGQAAVSEIGFAPVVSGSVSATAPRTGPGFPFLELRTTWMGDPRISTLSGSSTTFLGLVGYRFDVG